MGAHDFACQRLCAHAGVAQRLDVLPLPVALFHQLALFFRGFVEQARKGVALCRALFGELPVGCRLFVELLLQLVDVALIRSPAVAKLGMKAISLFLRALQPGPQILQVRSALFEELLELVLGGKGALKRFHGCRRFVERPLDGQHLLTRVSRVDGGRARLFRTG